MIRNIPYGYCFGNEEIFLKFSKDKTKLTCKLAEKYTGDRHIKCLLYKVFNRCIELVLEDIVYNNVTFILPVYGVTSSKIKMAKVTGEAFRNLRKAGKWRDVDFLKSNFSGYRVVMLLESQRSPTRVKPVHICVKLRDVITKKTNEGFPYGDGKVDTRLVDYLPQLEKEFPDILPKDIKTIVQHGWKRLYVINAIGGDTKVGNSTRFYCQIGEIRTGLRFYYYYIWKLKIKVRTLFYWKKVQWDGYYYFALTETQYSKMQQSIKTRGRPRVNFQFEKILLYKIYDECRLAEHLKHYIFRVKLPFSYKSVFYFPKVKLSNIEFVEHRKTLNFYDVSPTYHKYDFI